MKKLLLGFIIIFVFASPGCSQPKIDTSSDEKMKASISKVRESLPENKRHEFDEALQIISFNKIDLKNLFVIGTTGVNVIEIEVKQSLQGKTAKEVIIQALQIKKEIEVTKRDQALKEREQALSEIKELEEKQVKAQRDKIELAKFQIIRSRFYKQKQEFMGDQPIIELTVKNGTRYSVSRAYFKGTLASPGRSVPWLKDDFNYEISGGLEPGEEATWSLSPIMFSAWGTVTLPSDAIFTVEVEKLDGADGKILFSIKDFSDHDAKRLAELKKKYI